MLSASSVEIVILILELKDLYYKVYILNKIFNLNSKIYKTTLLQLLKITLFLSKIKILLSNCI